jgi:alpha-tubulin suppressor-like RCC1 family protein
VVCWGTNNSGQLGDGVDRHSDCDPSPFAWFDCSPSPVAVAGLSNVAEVTAGDDYTCARRTDGTVACWGENGSGQLGDGTEVTRGTPATVPGLANVVDVSAAGGTAMGTTCALDASGRAFCWGANTTFAPIAGTGATSNVPVNVPSPVLGLVDAVEIELGAVTACARRRDGSVVCWGGNAGGQLGDGTHSPSPVPVPVVVVTDAVEIDVGGQFACARRRAGTLTCWGLAPTWPAGLTDAVELAASESQACVRRATGAVVCVGTTAGDSSSVTDAARIDVGVGVACARATSGPLVCWGTNSFGQLGDGTRVNHTTPVPVVGFP